jgi:hypothetical protein
MKHLAKLLLMIFVSLPLVAEQPVLTFTEVDTDAHTRTLASTDRVVDINSRINLKIDRAALDARLPKDLNLPGIDPNIEARIKFLNDALQARDKNLQELKGAFSAAIANPAMSADDLNNYYSVVSRNAAPAVTLINQSPAGSIFQQRRRQYFAQPPAGLDPAHNALDAYAVTFLAAADEADQLRRDFEATASQNGVYVQLGAWVEDRPIHLEGFDTYPVGEHFVVERFNLALTEDQKKELANLAALSKKVNAEGLSALNLWRTAGQILLEQIATKSKTGECITSLKTQFETDKADITKAAAAIQTQYLEAKTKIEDYVASLEKLKKKYEAGGTTAGMPADQFLIQTNDDTLSLISDTKQLKDTLTKAADTLKTMVEQLSGDAKTRIASLLAAVNACAKTAGDEAEAWKQTILGQITALRTGSSFDRAALEFGDAVTKLALQDVPDSTSIPLTETGKRERGDALTVKLAVGTPNGKRVVISEGDFVLYQTLPYITLKVGLIFANPQGKDEATSGSGGTTATTGVKHFQTAPAYSVLLKRDSITNMFRNTLLDPGIGINVSALDFNHDDTPELGVGLVVSAFRDIIQLGYGYNLPQGKRYWFFGLRLPFPSLTLKGAQTGTSAAQ